MFIGIEHIGESGRREAQGKPGAGSAGLQHAPVDPGEGDGGRGVEEEARRRRHVDPARRAERSASKMSSSTPRQSVGVESRRKPVAKARGRPYGGQALNAAFWSVDEEGAFKPHFRRHFGV